jgi:D-alanyl-lipoteichoic acid acyltransferase DltB (MBOAT superfamily)
MSFNSTTFVFFFLFVFFTYWGLARRARARVVFLLGMSCVFYMSWNVLFIGLILFSATLDWFVGGAIFRSQDPHRRKLLLCLSLAGNLGALGFFKYFNFFGENVHAGLARLGLAELGAWAPFDIVLPVGISFYTFQTLSYTLDIYRRRLEPADSFAKFALFVAFFPQLVAGPIVRAREFLPQLELTPRFDDRRAATGVFLILTGLIKKVLLADTIGIELVDPIFADPSRFNPLEIWVGVCGALFQFYLDFSAYSDIAIGCAACLGFALPQNFDRPFMAQTFGDFWRRWHMTLSFFMRDYVFFPLGGTRSRGVGARGRNFMVTMLLVGLWHGAGWNYVIWGAMHGVCSFVGSELGRRRGEQPEASRFVRILRRAWIFNLVVLSMLFFRNGTLAEGNRGVAGSMGMLASLGDLGRAAGGISGWGTTLLVVAALIHFTPKRWVSSLEVVWMRLPSPAQALVLVVATGGLAAVAYQQSPFIYFQF